MSGHVPVLILDSDPAQRRTLSALLDGRAAYRPRLCGTAEEAIALAAAEPGAVLLADMDMVGGAASLGPLVRCGRPLIATSARPSLGTAVEAMRAGATDYLPKPIGARALVERLDAAVAAWRDRAASGTGPDSPSAVPAADAGGDFEGFIGRAPAMLRVFDQIDRIAASRAPVFVTGESGTGKEVCAEAIHARGGRDRPFVAINCSAIPRDLIESEVFGHVRGAFTGAVENRTGAAEQAHGGTLFLDEVCEMALDLQAKLLRFIQTGTVQRVGAAETRRVDVRFICATNRDPGEEVRNGRFREDLFYRLNVLPVRLPPLRDRREDVLPLARAFLLRYATEEGRRFAALSPAAETLLTQHDWPGNVRQLQNVIRRLVVLHDAREVTEAMLAPILAEDGGMPAASGREAPTAKGIAAAGPLPPLAPFHEHERRIIEAAMAACDGNISQAAAALRINPSTIYRKRQAWQAEADSRPR